MERKRLGKDIALKSAEHQVTVFSPKAAILLADRTLLLVRHHDSNWFGLPGGKVKKGEWPRDVNLLGTAAFPTLARELQEELEVDLKPILPRSKFAGLAEYVLIDSPKRVATHVFEPVLALTLDAQEGELFNHLQGNPNYCFYRLGGHPGQAVVFPSGRMLISALEGRTKERLGGWLADSLYYFQMRPQMQPLFHAPNWLR